MSTAESFTVSDNAGFISTSVSGSQVTINVSANNGTAARTGTVTITGCETETIAVTQSGEVPSGQSPYLGTNFMIPGVIEAEFYDNGGQGVAFNDDNTKSGDQSFRPSDNVDVYAKASASNGRSIGFSKNGEWVEFTTDIESGNYDIIFSYSSGSSNQGDLKISIDGTELTTITNISNTGGWTKFEDVTKSDIDISGGNNKVVRLEYVNGGGFDMDVIEFVKNDDEPCTLAVSKSSHAFSASASSTNVMVTTTESFTVSDNAGFISTSVNGNQVSISVTANGGSNSRSGQVTISGCETKVVSITQSGAVVDPPSNSGGKETFDNLSVLNQWSNGQFVGEDGIVWKYTKAKRTKNINGNTIKLDRSANGSLRADLTGGISALSFKARPTGTKQTSVIEVFINGVSQGTVTAPKNKTKTFNMNVSASGNFELRFKGVSGSDPQLDDISWSGSSARSIGSITQQAEVRLYPNPATEFITVKSPDQTMVQVFTLSGSRELVTSGLTNTRINISALTPGIYIIQAGANRLKFIKR